MPTPLRVLGQLAMQAWTAGERGGAQSTGNAAAQLHFTFTNKPKNRRDSVIRKLRRHAGL